MFREKLNRVVLWSMIGPILISMACSTHTPWYGKVIAGATGIIIIAIAFRIRGKLENRGVILTLKELPIEKPMVVMEVLPEINAICICPKDIYSEPDSSRVVSVMFSNRYVSGMNFKVSQYNIDYFRNSNKRYFSDGRLIIEIL